MRRIFLLMALGLGACAQTLTLQDALSSASAHNPRLAASAASREAAEARAVQARWDRVGRLDLATRWAPALQNPAFTFPGAPPAVPPQRFTLDLQYKNQIGITLDQPLWTWGSLAGRVRAAELHGEAEASGTVRERQRVAFEATRAYLQVRQAEAAVAVAEGAVDQEQAFLGVAQARFRAGQAPRLDTLKADLALSSATSELVARRNEVKLAREDLVTATSDERFREFPLAPAPEAILPQGDDAALVAEALSHRADLDALRRESRALHAEADAQRASGKPTLNLVGNLAQQKDRTGGLLQNENRTYLLGVALRWEGFSLSRSRARGAEKDAQAGERRAQGQGLEDQITHEVRTARLQLEDALAQVALAATSLVQAEEQARVARLAYREGVGTAVEAQDAELALTRARYQVLATALARETALALVRLAVGKSPVDSLKVGQKEKAMETRIVTVVGASGTLGSAIVRALLEKGAGVRAMVRATSDRTKLEALDVRASDLNQSVDIGCDVPATGPMVAAAFTRALGRPVVAKPVIPPILVPILPVLGWFVPALRNQIAVLAWLRKGGYVSHERQKQKDLFGELPTIEASVARYCRDKGLA